MDSLAKLVEHCSCKWGFQRLDMVVSNNTICFAPSKEAKANTAGVPFPALAWMNLVFLLINNFIII